MPGPFHFTHRLTRDAAYAALLASNRRALHAAAAATLRARHVSGAPGESELLRDLAAHLLAARDYAAAHVELSRLVGVLLGSGRAPDSAAPLAQAESAWDSARALDRALPAASARLLLARGDHARSQRDYGAAADCLAQALALARAAGDGELAAGVLQSQGAVEKELGRLEGAQRCFEMALEELDRAGRGDLGAPVFNALGGLHYAMGRLEDCGRCLDQGLALARAQNNLRLMGVIQGNRGVLHEELGELDAAEDCIEMEYATAREVGNLRSECWALAHHGSLAHTRNQVERARDYLERGYQLSAGLGDPLVAAFVEDRLASALLDLGELERIPALAGQTLAAARQRGDQRIAGSALTTLGRLAARQGDRPQALAHFHAAHAELTAAGDRHLLFHLLHRWLETGTAQDDPALAARLEAELDGLRQA